MTQEDYARAGRLFEQLRDASDAARDAALADVHSGLRREVLRLVDADRKAEANQFLTGRALEDASRLVTLDPASEAPALATGTRLGPYEILSMIGRGGMGEVYRARDTQLHREVAIKVLAPALASDALYMERFQAEAKILASLNHPNIATVYGIEQGALVMEFVEGENLRGPIEVDAAIPIARQIAVALEAAHERGIVHRDLKPANIKITPEGEVRLLDFGLAKSAALPGRDPGTSPTSFSSGSPILTIAGTVLGSAAYMAPEQATGKIADKRADIWAFGAVLFEMLTGERLFARETIAETLAAVVRDAPDLSKLPVATPAPVRRLLERCLRKDPKLRLRDIGEARVMLDEPMETAEAAAGGSRRWQIVAWALAAGAMVIASGLWLRPAASPQRSLKLSVTPPGAGVFSAISIPALSPDGRYLAFTAGRESDWKLWIRDLDSTAAKPVAESEGAVDPFWSPDSGSVAFFVPGKLKKTAVAGGPVVTICEAADGRGGSWSKDGVIVFAPTFASPLFRVSYDGGAATPVTTLEESNGETSHRFPWFLPDGRHFLFSVRSATPGKTAIYLASLDSSERRLVTASASNVAHAPGYLLFLRDSSLLAQPFDESHLKVAGEPAPVAQPVDYLPGSIQGQFAISQNGVLAYDSGGGALLSQMTWFDRAGKPMGTIGTPAVMQSPALSPDDNRVAVDRLDPATGTYDLWLFDLLPHRDSRFTFHPANDMYPIWSRDGRRIIFSSDRDGKFGIYRKAASGAEKEEPLYEGEGVILPTDATENDSVLFTNTSPATGNDVWRFSAAPDRKAAPLFHAKYSESHARLSPDGRWIVYESDESGAPQIYVQSFPGGEGKWQISTEGGTRPVWSRDGRELFYLSTAGKLTAVEVRNKSGFEHGAPQPLFEVRTSPTATFEVSRDGKRFLILAGSQPEIVAPMTIVVNWDAHLRK